MSENINGCYIQTLNSFLPRDLVQLVISYRPYYDNEKLLCEFSCDLSGGFLLTKNGETLLMKIGSYEYKLFNFDQKERNYLSTKYSNTLQDGSFITYDNDIFFIRKTKNTITKLDYELREIETYTCNKIKDFLYLVYYKDNLFSSSTKNGSYSIDIFDKKFNHIKEIVNTPYDNSKFMIFNNIIYVPNENKYVRYSLEGKLYDSDTDTRINISNEHMLQQYDNWTYNLLPDKRSITIYNNKIQRSKYFDFELIRILINNNGLFCVHNNGIQIFEFLCDPCECAYCKKV